MQLATGKKCVSLLALLTLASGYFAKNHNGESENQETSHSRQKRFVYFNTHSPVDIGFVVTVPLSFALPTFNFKSSRRFSRSISLENEAAFNLTAEDILPRDSYDNPAYAVELSKITTYFKTLEIDEDICQQRLICEVFAEPEKYKPVSSIFERQLKSLDQSSVTEKQSGRYYRYVHAMHEGMNGGEKACLDSYKKCPYATYERLNMPALHFWTYLTNILHMEFRDE